jgi:AcrR family transcriptional regulator
MSRSEEARQRIKEEQRKKILEAAGKVFARKGLAATMDDIADEASVSHGLAYRYFASKDALFFELVEQVFQAEPDLFQRVMELPGTPGERLDRLVSRFVESRKHPEFFQLFGEMLGNETVPVHLREMARERSLALQALLRQLIVEGQRTGEVADDDPDQLVRAIFACIDGLIRWAVYYPDQYNQHFPAAKIFLRMLKPEASDKKENETKGSE